VLDTVGNCSVIDSKPSAGLKIVGEKGGYESKESANQAMKNEVKCKGVGTGAAEPDTEAKFKAAEAKARQLGGVQAHARGYRRSKLRTTQQLLINVPSQALGCPLSGRKQS
jgi:hypothetical protein